MTSVYTTTRACVACRREHRGANDRVCLGSPRPHIQKGTPPAVGVERWWLAPPPEAAGRLSDRLLLAEAMLAAPWQHRSDGTVPAALDGLSRCLESDFWHLSAWTMPAPPEPMAPYVLLGLRHSPRFGSAARVFWLAGHHDIAHVIAVDLSREHGYAGEGVGHVAAAA